VDVAEIPGERAQRPLWRFAAGAIGAIVLLPAAEAEPLLEELSRALALPIVVCGPPEAGVPEILRGAPGGVVFEGSDAAEGLRALLAGAATRVG
jgi:CO dehydrogenase/acetyl-CoA synthase delta subunit